ncbi:MAG: diacylglycerol kinase family lipid kinase [Phycisphaerales bacterium]|nr:diacylglycerol kinase family lipid kinase [Phycisphaerales bacterium]
MGDERRFVIIYNPAAGGRRAARAAEHAVRILQEGDRHAESVATHGHGHAEEIAARWSAMDGAETCVVACGGDGTVQEVVNGLLSAGAAPAILGILPAGRCNDFARALGIPSDSAAAGRSLLGGETRSVDLGRAGGRYFCTVAAVGFDAVVSRYVNDHRLPLRGTSAYVFATLRALWSYRTAEMVLSGDFGVYEGPVFLAASGNTSSYGGAMRIAPDASPFDGWLRICLVTRIARWQVIPLLPRVMAGRHTRLSQVTMMNTRTIRIATAEGNGPMEVWADGEPMGTLPITIEAIPGAVQVIMPRGSSEES